MWFAGLPLTAPLIHFRYATDGPIWLDDLRCLAHEEDLTDCPHSGIGQHNCLHSEDVIISCLTSKMWRISFTPPPNPPPPLLGQMLSG
jgi:hypothetical protein